MAATFGLVKTTPHSIVYTIGVGDGAAGTLASATILGNMAAGPLKAEFTKLAAASQLDTLNLDGTNSGRVRARLVTGIDQAQTVPTSYNVHWTTVALSAQLVGGGSSLYLEIRLQHSLDR